LQRLDNLLNLGHHLLHLLLQIGLGEIVDQISEATGEHTVFFEVRKAPASFWAGESGKTQHLHI
jgi:hypothetical protein